MLILYVQKWKAAAVQPSRVSERVWYSGWGRDSRTSGAKNYHAGVDVSVTDITVAHCAEKGSQRPVLVKFVST